MGALAVDLGQVGTLEVLCLAEGPSTGNEI